MYRCVAATDVAWMLRSSYIHNGLDDAWIVATFQRPNRIDPCRFLGLKWFAKEHPVLLTGIFSGFSLDATGERVGFMLMHSCQNFRTLGIVRGVMSFCYIFRQHGPGRINIFCRGFFDSGGGVPARLSVALAADSAVCCVNLVDYAHIKKLRWLMQHASQQQSVDLATSMPSRCEACEKKFRKFSFTASGSGLMCNICRHVICSKCSVVKKMTIHVFDTGKIQQCALPFCLACLLQAKQMSAWELAI
ncbi:hypothetical protein CCR75_004336 [Bremia lactucae]|uniref:FYVE-type domain-containing protein n=1 Tax=Bremia lactucae TaxID=4779 RepID=A0A976FJI2_BRELC|nr:hypothetical protein CCR75_004336 [Bremia lactucae]